MKHSSPLGADSVLMARNLGSFPTSLDFGPQNNTTQPVFSIACLAMLVLKLAGFQISLFLSLCAFPIRAFNLFLTVAIFPFQMATHLRDRTTKKIKRALVAFVCDPLRSQKSVLKTAMRFTRAVFYSAYVFFVLLGLLVSGFLISGFVMRNLVHESVHATPPLNFDYTKTSPVAIVPFASSSKLKLTVSLTLPESEYNTKLGVFQVRVETLSENGDVVHGSSYPTMLRFKSQPVRACETLLKGVHLVAGLESEVQNLKIAMGVFEGTTSFKVSLEQRAEIRDGSGVPEIYGGWLEIESELPNKLKRVLWDWRRTLFVWTGIGSFLAETMLLLIFFRGVVLTCHSKKKRRHKAI